MGDGCLCARDPKNPRYSLIGIDVGQVCPVRLQSGLGHLFDQIEARLREALGEDALAVEHVGSTVVPGLSAKPLVDVLLVIPDFM